MLRIKEVKIIIDKLSECCRKSIRKINKFARDKDMMKTLIFTVFSLIH